VLFAVKRPTISSLSSHLERRTYAAKGAVEEQDAVWRRRRRIEGVGEVGWVTGNTASMPRRRVKEPSASREERSGAKSLRTDKRKKKGDRGET